MRRVFVLLLVTIISVGKGKDTDPPIRDRYQLQPMCLQSLQEQVNNELHASLVYLNMEAHFAQNKVARRGFAKFFKDSSDEERDHARKIMDFVNVRGGKLSLLNVKMPKHDIWPDALSALREALDLENKFYNKFYEHHLNAEHICKDVHLMDFLEDFLKEQADSIDQIQRIISMLEPMNNAMGEYFIDRQLLEGKIDKDHL